MANRRVMRRYLDKPVDPALLETLCAVALSAPSKSDLQQADIVIVSDKGQREKLEALLPDNPWVKAAPVFLVFCGNNRRHRLLFEWRGRPFVNDYLDPFFNAAVDAGIVLATFVAAADRVGPGQLPDQRHPQPRRRRSPTFSACRSMSSRWRRWASAGRPSRA